MDERTIIADLERRLLETETRHRLLTESWAQAEWETDADGAVVVDSPSWRAYTGQTPDEWLGYGWLDAIHPDDRAYAERQWREAIAARGLVNAEFRLRAPDGGWRWTNVRAAPLLDAGSRIEKWVGINIDIDERKEAEAALRESEERQAFLLKLSDALRPLDDPAEIQNAATRVLGQHLRVSRVAYVRVTDDEYVIEQDYVDGVPSMAGSFRVNSFGTDKVADYQGGKTRIVRDTEKDARNDPVATSNFAAFGVAAGIGVPLIKGGRFVATLVVHMNEPRDWSPAEVVLAEETAERTWQAVERARAETALRDSETRFSQFGDASSAGLWVRDAQTLTMEYASPSVGTIYGVELGALLGDVEKWAALIVPEDRDTALEHLQDALQGKSVVHEFRVQRPSDGTFRWIRNTDFPLDQNGHVGRIGGIAEDVTETKLAVEHQGVLLAELQHRVRNIMALLRSITNRTADRAESVTEYRDLMMGRLLAFARVQALLTRSANVCVGIASIVHDEVSVQAQHEEQYVIDGPDVALSPKAAEVLTLAIHELATNAVKYGALSVPDGKVTVRWSTFEKRGGLWLAFDWTEEGAPVRPTPSPDAPRRRGFGSELIEGRIPYELRGRGEVRIEPNGARCHLEFPLQDGASILETGAPQRATVFGGAIDMTGEPDLTGRRVLVVEDDYYLATDAARALRGAGADVMGPCATEEDARAELDDQRPDAVVVDINLGPGPSFKLAETLKDLGIPFVFTTGYDAEIIPAEFEGIERLEKPLQLRQIVGAVAKLTTAA